MKRTVYAAQIKTEEFDLFESVLLNPPAPVKLGTKEVEISHIENSNDFLTGIFVSTQKADLPPQHTPGDDEDYSAIPIEDGKGLAYPNVFLYDRVRHLFLWEANAQGMNIDRFGKYFGQYDKIHDTNITAEFLPVTTTDFMERVSKLYLISTLDITIADPLKLVERAETALSTISKIAQEENATKSVELKLKATYGKTLSLASIKQLLQEVFQRNNEENAKIKCKTKGYFFNDEGNTEETTIDLLIDRFKATFDLTKNEKATLQVAERKGGIIECYNCLLRMLSQLNVV